MTDEFEKDEAVIAAATPGPWVGWAINVLTTISPRHGGVCGLPMVALDHSTAFLPEDAIFIGAARTRWPAAIAEVKRLRAILDAIAQRTNERPVVEYHTDGFILGYAAAIREIQSFIAAELEKK